MTSIEMWQATKRRIKLISCLEIVSLVICFSIAMKFGGEYAVDLAIAAVAAVFVLHILVLIRYWRCPMCNKVQPFWDQGHRASVGSLTNCAYCGVPYV